MINSNANKHQLTYWKTFPSGPEFDPQNPTLQQTQLENRGDNYKTLTTEGIRALHRLQDAQLLRQCIHVTLNSRGRLSVCALTAAATATTVTAEGADVTGFKLADVVRGLVVVVGAFQDDIYLERADHLLSDDKGSIDQHIIHILPFILLNPKTMKQSSLPCSPEQTTLSHADS